GELFTQLLVVIPALLEEQPHLADQPIYLFPVGAVFGVIPRQVVVDDGIDPSGDSVALLRQRAEPLEIVGAQRLDLRHDQLRVAGVAGAAKPERANRVDHRTTSAVAATSVATPRQSMRHARTAPSGHSAAPLRQRAQPLEIVGAQRLDLRHDQLRVAGVAGAAKPERANRVDHRTTSAVAATSVAAPRAFAAA